MSAVPGPSAAALPAALVDTVQRNCDIADAAQAAELSMCNFLLQMREYFRWRHGLGFDAALARDEVGRWLARTEAHWDTLQDEPLAALPIGAARIDPFDVDAANAWLIPRGWIYGAGLAGPGRAGFFLAELRRLERGVAAAPALTVQHAGRELARGLFAPPAALQGSTVVLRHESIERWLWERYEAFALRRGDVPFAAVAEAFGMIDAGSFLAALPRVTALAARMLLWHEIGEHRAAATLEPGWAALRLSVQDRRAALWLRAVRDHLADLRVTLPALRREEPAPALHLWFAQHEGAHAALFPGLAGAYRAWCADDGGAALERACTVGLAHFEALAQELLRLGDARQVAQRLAQDSAVCAAVF